MKKILIFEDDKLVRWTLREILSREGYSVKEVVSSEEALKSAAETKYDLIIADFEINQGNSADVLKSIKKLQPSISIIILSARSKMEIEKLLINLNIFGIVEKPFHGEQIKALAKKALKKPN